MNTSGTTTTEARGAVRQRVPRRSQSATPPAVDADVVRTAPSAERIAAHIESAGAWCLKGVVSDDWVARTLAEARQHVTPGVHEVILSSVESHGESLASTVVNDPDLRTLLASVVAAAAPHLDTRSEPVRAQLRIIAGEDPLARPLGFHYDRSVVTMVVPLLIPAGAPGESGELAVVPNRRPMRRSALVNVIEKAVVQAVAVRRRFARRALTSGAAIAIPLTAGNAYLFWGYRTYHTTLPCPPDSLRVTLVMHFGDVHGDSRVLGATKRLSQYLRLRGDTTTEVL